MIAPIVEHGPRLENPLMDAGHHRGAHFNLTSPARPTRHCCRLNDVWPPFSKTSLARIVVTTAGSLTQAARSAACFITLTALVSHDTSISTLTPVSANSLACPSMYHSNVLRDPSTISSVYKRFQKHNGIRREVKGVTPCFAFCTPTLYALVPDAFTILTYP